MSNSRHVDAGEVEVEHAGQRVALEHDVVAEQVGVDRAARQRRIRRRRGEVLLVRELVGHQRGLFGVEDAARRPASFGPPRQAAQVRLRQRGSRAPARCMRASTSPTAPHVGGVGREVVLARQAVDDRRRLALRAEQRSRRSRRPAAPAPGMPWSARCFISADRTAARRRPGARTASARSARRGVGEIVGVLDPAADGARASRSGPRPRRSISAAASSNETSV